MISFLITLLLLIIVIGILVFVHELGHFATARSVGVKVEEFAIGMGPKLFGVKRGDTIYTIRAFPIGGYVKMFGEDDQENHSSNSFGGKNPIQRLFILVAGVSMNFLLAVLLLYVTGFNLGFQYRNAEIPGITEDYRPWFGEKSADKLIIADIAENSVLKNTEISTFDILLTINGEDIDINNLNSKLISLSGEKVELGFVEYTSNTTKNIILDLPALSPELLNSKQNPLIRLQAIENDSPLKDVVSEGSVIKKINGSEYEIQDFRSILQENIGKETTFFIYDFEKERDVEVTLNLVDKERPLKVIISNSYSIEQFLGVRTGLISFIEFKDYSAFFAGFGQALNIVQNFFLSMGRLINNAFSSGSAVPVVDNVGGAVTIFDILGRIVLLFGFWGLIELMILLSINLAIINLLPIPALDGGHVIFTLYEIVFGKKLPNKIYNFLTMIGFAFLIFLMVFITFLDIAKFREVNNFLCGEDNRLGFVCEITVRD
jgi:regulator of sigma E protease